MELSRPVSTPTVLRPTLFLTFLKLTLLLIDSFVESPRGAIASGSGPTVGPDSSKWRQ